MVALLLKGRLSGFAKSARNYGEKRPRAFSLSEHLKAILSRHNPLRVAPCYA
jgi:hypothetical protein